MNQWRPAQFLLFVVPLVWIVIALIHPDEPQGESGRWLFVHFAQLVLAPLLALAVWTLLDGIRSQAATVSRVAVVVWVVAFVAYDSVAGIATGLFAHRAEELAGAEQAAVDSAVDWLLNDGLLPGAAVLLAAAPTLAWVITVIAAAVALYQAGAGRAVAAALCLSALFLFHASYPAVVGLVFFLIAAVLWERKRVLREVVGPTPPATA